MEQYQDLLKNKLSSRSDSNSLRILKDWPEANIDFFSNDYLGLANSVSKTDGSEGSGGSRLLAGNHKEHIELEAQLSAFYGGEALLFNSGFDANLSLFSSIPQKGDVILYDSKVHNSIRQGIRLSHAQAYKFEHNDLDKLEVQLKKHEGKNVFVGVESVYSMDGNSCDLPALVTLCEKYKAAIILDEAHSNGILGKNGEGMAVEYGLEKKIFARMMGFGKAIGRHGSAVVGSNALKDYLLNFAHPFIYSTAMSCAQVNSIKHAFEVMGNEPERRKSLFDNIQYFKEQSSNLERVVATNSPIQFIKAPGNKNAKELAKKLIGQGINIAPVLSPTVDLGFERLRVCLHSFNTKDEIDLLLSKL